MTSIKGTLAHDRPPSGQRDLLVSVRWFGIPLLVLVAASGLYRVTQARSMESVIGVIIAVALAIVLLRLVVVRRTLTKLHLAIQAAQEGKLEPLPPTPPSDKLLRRLVFDYNLLIKNFGTLFGEMENCQRWIIGERNKIDAILRSLPGALLCVDGDLKINLSNRYAEDLFRSPQEDLTGRNLFDVLQLDECGIELLREAFLYERQVSNKEIALKVDDVDRYFTLNLAFFWSQSVGEMRAAIVLQDITDYKRLQELTYHSEKLVAMGGLAAGVAHELNTPLGNIIGYAQLVKDGLHDGSPQERYVQVIYTEAKRCSRIVENLLAYGRRDHCQPDNCQINTVIHEVTDSMRSCQGKRYNVDIQVRLAGNPKVKGGAGQLEIAFVNLLLNAAQATGGRIEPPLITITSVIERDTVAIAVEDNGPGVPADVRNRIFDPFFSTKDVGEGNGLGLAISQSIVARIGGTIRYDATYKEGARFILKLPLAEET